MNFARVRQRKPRTSVLGHFQPSLTGLFLGLIFTQDCVLGYSQPSLRDWSRYALRASYFQQLPFKSN
jgi:hypothetical protein